MLIEFSVQNFGPIREEQTLSMIADKEAALEDYYVVQRGGLRLLKLALLYGPNASGKTTLLKALQFLRHIAIQPAEDKSRTLKFMPFEFDQSWRASSSCIKIAFLAGDIRHSYTVEFTRDYIVAETMIYFPNGREAELYSRRTDPGKELTRVTFGSTVDIKKREVDILEGNTIWNTTVLAAFAKTNVDIPALQRIRSWFIETLMPAILPISNLTDWAVERLEHEAGLKALVTELMRKADVQISDIRIEKERKESDDSGVMAPLAATLAAEYLERYHDAMHSKMDFPRIDRQRYLPKYQVHFEHTIEGDVSGGKPQSLPAAEESSGTLRYLGLSTLLALLIQHPGVLCIDEIETSIHPELIKHFLLTFLENASHSQLILTTHHTALLDERDILRPDAIWLTQKRPDGATELYSVAEFNTAVLRKKSSIGNAYRIGKLGALPNPGSIFLDSNGNEGTGIVTVLM